MSIIKKIKDKFPASGELKKLVFTAYQDIGFSKKSTTGAEFKVMFNPNTINLKYQVNRNEQNTANQTNSEMNFIALRPEEFGLEFILDGTGVNANSFAEAKTPPKVYNQVQDFLAVVYNYDGDTHQNKFVRVKYGSIQKDCVLVNLDVSYTLFSRDGEPLRAKVNAAFKTVEKKELTDAKVKKSSPDLTHLRELKQSDRFTLMANDIYDENFLFTRVARANQLNSFRNIPVGSRLIFPPLVNQSE